MKICNNYDVLPLVAALRNEKRSKIKLLPEFPLFPSITATEAMKLITEHRRCVCVRVCEFSFLFIGNVKHGNRGNSGNRLILLHNFVCIAATSGNTLESLHKFFPKHVIKSDFDPFHAKSADFCVIPVQTWQIQASSDLREVFGSFLCISLYRYIPALGLPRPGSEAEA